MNVQGNVAIEGTITFGGGGTTVSAANLSVTDPFVFVGAANQADISDLGFIAEHTVAVSAITATVSNKALTNNVATLTTAAAHTYRDGDVVVVSGVDATFNGTYSITSVNAGANTFTYAKTASNVGSTAASGSTSVSARRVFDGIARDATDNVVKFFQNAVTKPTTTVNFSEAGLTYADILVKGANVTGDLTVATNKLTVNASTGAVGINNALTVGGTAGITGVLTATGAINAQNTLTVAGQTSLGATNVTGTMNVTGDMVVTGRFEVQEIREYVVESTIGTVTANVLTADFTQGNIYWVNTSPTANFTVNLTNVPTDNLYSMSVTVVVNQGATGYIPNAFQIAGVGTTLRWTTGTAPTPTSTANKLDVFSFTLIRRASAWIVIGSSVLNF
jgi:hypothetical protein